MKVNGEWLAKLPEHVRCEQDVQDVFDLFERAANEYVRARVDFDALGNTAPRQFFRDDDPRLVSEHHLERLGAFLGRGPAEYVCASEATSLVHHMTCARCGCSGEYHRGSRHGRGGCSGSFHPCPGDCAGFIHFRYDDWMVLDRARRAKEGR